MKLAGLRDTSQHMLAACNMHSACNRNGTFGQHKGAMLPDLLQVARDRCGYASAGNVDYGD